MEKSTEKKPKWRWGVFRWLFVLVVIANVYASSNIKPIRPHVQVPAENIAGPFTLPVLGEIYLTNTIVAMLIADLILLVIAFSVWRAVRRGDMVLSGIAGVMELLIEGLYGLVESTAGKYARRIFPWMATIVLLVLVINWMELIPGVDSIGALHEPHHDAPAYPTEEVFSIGSFSVTTIVEAEDEQHEEAGESLQTESMGFTPYVRVTSTDLNFTVALALVSVVMIQIIGVQAQGLGYFTKFLAFGDFGRMWFKEKLGPFDVLLPLLNIFVGLLEFVAEIAKVISFSFRLFGNIFAGAVILFVIGWMVPVVVQSGFLLLEFLVGVIQAVVFGMLTMVFMTMATIAHGDHDEGHAESHA